MRSAVVSVEGVEVVTIGTLVVSGDCVVSEATVVSAEEFEVLFAVSDVSLGKPDTGLDGELSAKLMPMAAAIAATAKTMANMGKITFFFFLLRTGGKLCVLKFILC